MVCVTFYDDGGLLVGFSMRGHAGAAEAGRDIVCAAISSAAYLAANTVTQVLGLKADLAVYGGRMRLVLTHGAARKAQAVLAGLRLHLEELAKEYPDYLNVKGRGVKHAQDKHPIVRP